MKVTQSTLTRREMDYCCDEFEIFAIANGMTEKGNDWRWVNYKNQKVQEIGIFKYCPFCGSKLDE